MPFLDHIISVQGFCSSGFPREVSLLFVELFTLIPHGIRVSWDELGSPFFFVDHSVFFIMQGPLQPLVAMFFAVFLGPLGPILTFVSLHVLIFSVIFLVWSV